MPFALDNIASVMPSGHLKQLPLALLHDALLYLPSRLLSFPEPLRPPSALNHLQASLKHSVLAPRTPPLDLLDLPNELLLEILTHLSPFSIATVSRTCTHLRALTFSTPLGHRDLPFIPRNLPLTRPAFAELRITFHKLLHSHLLAADPAPVPETFRHLRITFAADWSPELQCHICRSARVGAFRRRLYNPDNRPEVPESWMDLYVWEPRYTRLPMMQYVVGDRTKKRWCKVVVGDQGELDSMLAVQHPAECTVCRWGDVPLAMRGTGKGFAQHEGHAMTVDVDVVMAKECGVLLEVGPLEYVHGESRAEGEMWDVEVLDWDGYMLPIYRTQSAQGFADMMAEWAPTDEEMSDE